MKIEKWVTFEQRVEIQITGSEAAYAVTDVSDFSEAERQIKAIVSNVYGFFKGMPEHAVAHLTPECRQTVYKGLLDVAERFK